MLLFSFLIAPAIRFLLTPFVAQTRAHARAHTHTHTHMHAHQKAWLMHWHFTNAHLGTSRNLLYFLFRSWRFSVSATCVFFSLSLCNIKPEKETEPSSRWETSAARTSGERCFMRGQQAVDLHRRVKKNRTLSIWFCVGLLSCACFPTLSLSPCVPHPIFLYTSLLFKPCLLLPALLWMLDIFTEEL